MPAKYVRNLTCAAPVLEKTCDVCGDPNPMFGFKQGANPSRWYCAKHCEEKEKAA